MRTKLEALERARTEPIAIVGMACRIPGGANTPESFFKLLEDGVDTISEIPSDRWRVEHDGPNSDGDTRALRWGSFLTNIDRFDASFFGISPREAESLDPQHRLLLEVTWEALERAGQLPERLMGTKTGVFVGIWAPDYQLRVLSRDPNDLDAYCFTGTVLSTAAGRLSYILGVQGPCMAIDTACSSSLTAIHLACQSLRSGESTMAIAGGVNLMLAPSTTNLLSKTQALSPDGRCKTFDARANGYVRGEGCGMLVLKRLSDAERDGDSILALIRGSAVNQDGRSTGLTAPNVLSQQALLRQALENARLSPQDITYLETHGTGTSLGDPIEVEAIKAVFGAPRDRGAKCFLGALKSNIGHLEAAAGVAGVVKAVLALQNEKIPGNLHFRSLNPRIDLSGTSLEIAQSAKPWAPGMRTRYAGVSSFGISGTNAHVIIEEAPKNLEEALLEDDSTTVLLPISAKSHEGLRAHAAAYRDMLKADSAPRLLDIVYTASARRSHYVHRLSVVGRTKDELADSLDAHLREQTPPSVSEGKASPARAKIVFVFSGQGSQWLGMGRQLYESDASFRSVIDTCDNLMTSRLGWSILDELDAPESMSRINDTQVAQPLLFAVQVALVEMLRSWGISPDAMIGHSVGEIAAAHIAGILSLDEAIRLVAIRGRIMQKATGMGKMVAVAMTPGEAQAILAGYEDRVAIAAINDPNSVVLSGAAQALDDIVLRCEKRGISTRALRVDYAFHSPQMDAFEHELVERLGRVDTRRATLAMYSTTLADCVDGNELDVHYWGRNIRQTVDLAGAVFAAIRDGYQLFLEIGPHPVLTNNLQQCLTSRKIEGAIAYTMRRNHDQRHTLLEAIGTLYTRGCMPEWSRVVPSGGRTVALPTYPWQKERYLVESNLGPSLFSQQKDVSFERAAHPLLGTELSLSMKPGVHIWQHALGPSTSSWIPEHTVQGMNVFPGAGYVEMALGAAALTFGQRPIVIEDLLLERMLVLSDAAGITVQTVLDSAGDMSAFHVASRLGTSGTWQKHTQCRVDSVAVEAAPVAEALEAIQARCTEFVSKTDHYQRLEARGLFYGDHFRGVEELRIGPNEVIAQIIYPFEYDDEYIFHPAHLDACFQVAALLADDTSPPGALIPIRISRISLRERPGRRIWVHVRAKPAVEKKLQTMDLVVRNEQGDIIVEIDEFAIRRLEQPHSGATDKLEGCTFRAEWQPKAICPEPIAEGEWIVVGAGTKLDYETIALLEKQGHHAIHVILSHRQHAQHSNVFAIDADNANDFGSILGQIVRKSSHCNGLIYLGATTGAPWHKTTSETLDADLRFGSVGVLHTVQAIARQALRDPPRIWLVTQGAQCVDSSDAPVSISQASIWGMGRTISLEHPEFACTCIDMDSGETPQVHAMQLVAELLGNDHEDQIALRRYGRFVARLSNITLPQAFEHVLPIRTDGSYLITGGLGGLGLSLAQGMVEQGARYIALMGRNGANEAARAVIDRMMEAGAHVIVIQRDVAQKTDVDAALARIDDEFPPLRGIVHAAAVLADHTVLELSAAEVHLVHGPKVRGALNLHAATKSRPLDFFILYSSATALLGSPGQSNYSAANAAMDAIARARATTGLPAISVQWGPFSEVGLAVAQDNRASRFAQRGLESLSPRDGLEALSRMGGLSFCDIAVMRFDVRRWLEFQPQAVASAFWNELRKERAFGTSGSARNESFRTSLETMSDTDRRNAIEEHVRNLISRVLHIQSNRVDLDATFTSLGMDSLTSLELRNWLEAKLELKLPATLLFTYPTTRTIIEFLISQLSPISPQKPSADDNITTNIAHGEIDLSADDDLLAEFDASLASIKKQGFL